MLLLVTDTSGRQGSVALARARQLDRDRSDPAVIEVVPLAGGAFSAQLVPQIAALLARHGFTKADLEAFIVVSGPGSFTGLRVGLAAIKALAEILKKPIVAVTLLESVALESRTQGKICAVLDAGRGDVYFGSYEIAGDSVRVLREELLSKTEALSLARGATVATPDLTLAATAREANLSVVVVEPPSATMIAGLGWRKLQAGETVSPEQLEANYMRRSDAEMFVKPASSS
jgi:tRNA threonylcarbamoyladenosine biosynthesis protein TsaB